jgi:hypothetical protein
MVGNRNSFEWDERLSERHLNSRDLPNFGALVRREAQMPMHIHHEYHHIALPHGQEAQVDFGTDDRLLAEHHEDPLSLGIIYDVWMHVGVPRSRYSLYSLYNARRMSRAFTAEGDGLWGSHPSSPEAMSEASEISSATEAHREGVRASAGEPSGSAFVVNGWRHRAARREARNMDRGRAMRRDLISFSGTGVQIRFRDYAGSSGSDREHSPSSDAGRSSGRPAGSSVVATRAEHEAFRRSVMEDTDPALSPSRRPHLVAPYRDGQPGPSSAPGPIRRHSAATIRPGAGAGEY